MCSTILLRKSLGGLSRNPTVSLTPLLPQYFVVNTAILCFVGAKPFSTSINRLIGGWFSGLIWEAVLAAETQRFWGSLLGKQTIASSGVFFVGIGVLLFEVVGLISNWLFTCNENTRCFISCREFTVDQAADLQLSTGP